LIVSIKNGGDTSLQEYASGKFWMGVHDVPDERKFVLQ